MVVDNLEYLDDQKEQKEERQTKRNREIFKEGGNKRKRTRGTKKEHMNN